MWPTFHIHISWLKHTRELADKCPRTGMEAGGQRPATCIYCQQRAFAPRWFSEYRVNGPREQWGPFYIQSTDETQPPGEGYLFWYCVCGPTCKANTAVQRYETARLEIARSLEELQRALIDALEEVGQAWHRLDE